jgi:hypothetical protein
LKAHTLKNFLHGLATKCDISPSHIVEMAWVNSQGIHVRFDDESVCELANEQAMVAEFIEVEVPPAWRTSPSSDVDRTEIYRDHLDGGGPMKSKYYKVKLFY